MEKCEDARKIGGAVGEIWEERGQSHTYDWQLQTCLACVLVFLPTYLPEFEHGQADVNTHTHTTFKIFVILVQYVVYHQ
jgi:hypothetical protein